jgi:hypothetical protein
MFMVDEATITAIREAYAQGGELAATVELLRLFPGIDRSAAPTCPSAYHRGHGAATASPGEATAGPNMLVVELIGWQVSGFAGALCLPTSLLTYFTAKLWDRFHNAFWRRSQYSVGFST